MMNGRPATDNGRRTTDIGPSHFVFWILASGFTLSPFSIHHSAFSILFICFHVSHPCLLDYRGDSYIAEVVVMLVESLFLHAEKDPARTAIIDDRGVTSY